jgi:hypothetical protein
MYHIETLKRKNSRRYTKTKDIPTIEGVKEYMRGLKLSYAGTPYVFTHIKLSNGDIITQSDDRFGLICSPEELRKQLIK